MLDLVFYKEIVYKHIKGDIDFLPSASSQRRYGEQVCLFPT